MPIEVNPQETTRAAAFRLWMNAPMPMVTFFRTLDVTRLIRFSQRKKMKFNMLMCWCIGRAASQVKEFRLLPVNGKLMQYDQIAVWSPSSSITHRWTVHTPPAFWTCCKRRLTGCNDVPLRRNKTPVKHFITENLHRRCH